MAPILRILLPWPKISYASKVLPGSLMNSSLQQKTMATLLDMQEEAIIDILLLFQINIK
jgi:hypothetical protein